LQAAAWAFVILFGTLGLRILEVCLTHDNFASRLTQVLTPRTHAQGCSSTKQLKQSKPPRWKQLRGLEAQQLYRKKNCLEC
jgi:hypothetical protein